MRNLIAAVGLTGLACGLVSAQSGAPAPTSPHVVNLLHFIHATDTLEPTLAFYHDVFGIDSPAPRANNNPGVALLNNVPGLGLRATRPTFPGEKFGIEMTQFSNVERKGGKALPTDPGSVELILPVRDIDAVYAAAKKLGAPIVSRTGGPVTIATANGKARALLLRDPDGYLARAVEVAPADATAPGLVQPGVSMGITVKDMNVAAKFYHDVLALDLSGSDAFARDAALSELVGAPASSEVRHKSVAIPGTNKSRLEFYEWKGMPRTPFSLRVPDPGAGGMVLQVTDLDAMVKIIKTRGVRMVTPEPVWFTNTLWDIFVADPDGVNLELYESKPAPPAR